VTNALTERRLVLHSRVAVRPEPFGALAYHYGTRRLVFLKHPDIVRVVRSLGEHATVGEALDANGIATTRRQSFVTALQSLVDSEMLIEGDPP
jgi:putative mycofactocin binding protein MftB